MMETIKLFGGPAHGRTERMREPNTRIEVMERAPLRTASLLYAPPPEALLELPSGQIWTYYIKEYMLAGWTEAGAQVRKSMYVGLWEGNDLTRRESWELEDALMLRPWYWPFGKPNFLTQFDQWFEYTLCEVSGRQPKVRY